MTSLTGWGEGPDAPGVERVLEQGLEAVRVANEHGSLLVFRHGAHVARYAPKGGQEVLWMSQRSRFQAGAPIRGGIPICFPWFGPHASEAQFPAHGFARTRPFHYRGSAVSDGGTKVSFALEADGETRALFPYAFGVVYEVVLGPVLELRLRTTNLGTEAFEFEEALHSYFGVGEVTRAQVLGLEGASYDDKVAGGRHVETRRAITIAEEVDRVYASPVTTEIVDPVFARRIIIEKAHSATTVVWNPWVEKSKRMSDFGDDEYPGMLCIESANTGPAKVRLDANEVHELRVRIRSEAL